MFSSVRLHLQPLIIRNYKSYRKKPQISRINTKLFSITLLSFSEIIFLVVNFKKNIIAQIIFFDQTIICEISIISGIFLRLPVD
jgi:hypothetical protein